MLDMFYGASSKIFERAKELRKNMTGTERILWGKLSNNKLKGYKFRRQHPIASYIADFYCHQVKLIIEIDGDYHLEMSQKEYDIGRTYDLESFGIQVIRFTNFEVEKDINKVLSEILKYLP